MTSLLEKMQNYINQPEVQDKLKKMAEEFLPEYLREPFVELIENALLGDMHLSGLIDYFQDWYYLSWEEASALDDRLLKEIFTPVYQEAADLYEEKLKTELDKFTAQEKQHVFVEHEQIEQEIQPQGQNTEINSDIINTSTSDQVSASKTSEQRVDNKFFNVKFNAFINSSLYQNALAWVEENKSQSPENINENFYQAINTGDPVKTLGWLILIANNGWFQEKIAKDKRYQDFWKKYLVETGREAEIINFYEQPDETRYLIEFIRYILEKKCGLSEAESAMTGVALGNIFDQQKESAYSQIAYGDTESGQFVWSRF